MDQFSKAQDGLIDTNGYKTYYRAVGSDQSRPPLLCLHGGPGNSHDYLRSLSSLADERPVIFYDQFGTGRSDGREKKSKWTVETFVDQLQAVRDQLGLNDIHLYGHSWGGMLALAYLKDRDMSTLGIRSLTLASTMYDIPAYMQDTDQLLKDISPNVFATARKHEADGTTGNREYKEINSQYNQTYLWRGSKPQGLEDHGGVNYAQYNKMWGPSEFCVNGSLKDFSATEWMNQITIPTLVVVGEFDEATPSMAERTASLLPNAHYEVIEGGAHLVHVENPKAYTQALSFFLVKHDKDNLSSQS